MFNDFEKNLYKFLFDEFSNGNHHIVLSFDDYDREQLSSAIKHLSESGIILIIFSDSDSVEVELDYQYCYKFVEL